MGSPTREILADTLQTRVIRMKLPEFSQLLPIARTAGEHINALYRTPDGKAIECKADNTPLTLADQRAHTHITNALAELTPAWPILSEEATLAPFETRQHWNTYWLIDPLDGTKEFIHHNDEFTVNIALIHAHQPILGIVYAPALDLLYYAARGQGASKLFQNETLPLHVKKTATPPLKVVASRFHNSTHLQEKFDTLPDFTVTTMGSSLKLCAVAEGQADLYPRLGPTSEWDIAAAQCVLEEAGGLIETGTGPLRYNTKDSVLNPGFIATHPALLDKYPEVLDLLKL